MDTLTHTLAGWVLGECAARTHREPRSTVPLEQRRRVYVSMLCVGSNLPDIDFLYSALTGSKLDYLLHHRGHSHTLVGVLVAAAVLFICAWAWQRRTRAPVSASDLRWLALWALVGPVLHVAMDWTTTYGVHPFWPFDARWFYGDAVFIVEPLLWAAAAPLIGLLHSRWRRVAVGVVIAATLALLISTGLLPRGVQVLVVAALLAGLILGHWLGVRAVLFTAVTAWCLVTLVFLAAHRRAVLAVDEFLARTDPTAVTLDRILTPLPANPLCWEVILVQLRAERYTLRRATLALAPDWMTAAACPNRDLDVPTTVPLSPVTAGESSQWQWAGEWVAAPGNLTALMAARCEAAAYMRFARAPWWIRTGSAWQLGDLRYDREPTAGFAEIELTDGVLVCPRHPPPWRPPRSEVFSAPTGNERRSVLLHFDTPQPAIPEITSQGR